MSVIDLSSHGDYLLLLLPESVIALFAMIVLMVDVFRRGRGRGSSGPWVARVTLVGVALAAAAAIWLGGVDVRGTGGLVAVDGFRLVASLIVLGATALAVVYADEYLDREGLRVGEFYVLLLLACVGMLVLVAARDLILLFIALELMSISVYVLTGFARGDPRSSEAGLKYFIVGAFASAFLLYGIALVYGATGSTQLGVAADAVVAASGEGDLLLTAGIGMLLIGFGFKVAAVPFHMWTPDVYEGAPTPVTGYMATAVKAAAFVAILRTFTVDLLPASEIWKGAVWWLAMLTMIVPNLIALSQENVKRMLAYSSVAHAGYLLVGVMAASALGRAASLFYLAAYTLMTIGAFAIVYHVAGRGDRHSAFDDYRGLGWKRPWLGAALVVFLLSLAGFPPTAGFVGKLFLLRSAVEAGETALAVTLVLTSLVAYYYYLRVVWKMYFDSAPEGVEAPARGGTGFRLATGVCAVALVLAGLFPGGAIDRLRSMSEPAGLPAAVTAPAVEAVEASAGEALGRRTDGDGAPAAP